MSTSGINTLVFFLGYNLKDRKLEKMPPRKPTSNVQRAAASQPAITDETVLNQTQLASDASVITNITAQLNTKVQEIFGLDNPDLLV